ncbi:MAG: 30S ribosomal protein S12 methylthiotransferase RimO [Bacillota bacterium]|nr:30S ribosomal protein S12 methylthiotransferase RimO [Bacillota bacterium]
MKKKIGVISLGCPKNLVDTEIMLGILRDNEYEITNKEEEAEIIIINTCGFIESAKKESIEAILEMAHYKQDKCRLLIVTGCLAERYREEIIKEIPEVDAIIGVGNYSEICDVILEASNGKKVVKYGKLDEIDYLEGERLLTYNKGYAYLKIAEGCDNRCTYCIIPYLRGHYRSRKMEDLVNEAGKLAKAGVKEIILVAQDTTRYGTDIYGTKKLAELIRKISEIGGLEWIRLLYCYPEEIDDELIDEIAGNPKVCKYLDIPIQHASNDVLRAMGRRGTAEQTEELLHKLKSRIPGLILRTSLIVGFPGEDNKDFEKLFEFVNEFMFDRLGVFIYSKEEGTPAAKIRPQVKSREARERYKDLMSLQKKITTEKNHARLDKTYKVIVEGVADDGIFYYGRSYSEAPEIDGLIYFTSSEPVNIGDFVSVKILNVDDYDLIGDVVDESSK